MQPIATTAAVEPGGETEGEVRDVTVEGRVMLCWRASPEAEKREMVEVWFEATRVTPRPAGPVVGVVVREVGCEGSLMASPT